MKEGNSLLSKIRSFVCSFYCSFSDLNEFGMKQKQDSKDYSKCKVYILF